MAQNMNQANIDQLGAWRAQGNQGDLPVGWQASSSSGGSGSSGSSGSGGTNYVDIAKQIMELQKQANQPAVQTLQSSIPTTQQAFQQKGQQLTAQVDPLKQRYQGILDSLKQTQQVDVQSAQIASSREFGKRGVPLSSGAYDQYVNQQILPVNAAYGGKISETALTGEEALRSLQDQIANNPIEQQKSVDAINQAIASLQAGGNSEAIKSALSLYQQQQSDAQKAQETERQKKIDDLNAQVTNATLSQSSQTNPLQLQILQQELLKAQNANKTTSGGSGALEWLQTQFNT